MSRLLYALMWLVPVGMLAQTGPPAYAVPGGVPACTVCAACTTEQVSLPLTAAWLDLRAERKSPGQVQLDWAWEVAQPIQRVSLYCRQAAGLVLVHTFDSPLPQRWTHANAYEGLSYYQARATLADGSMLSSPIRQVAGQQGRKSLRVYPNPTQETLLLRLDGEDAATWELRLYDAQGRVVRQERLPLTPHTPAQLSGLHQLPAGTYWLELQRAGRRYHQLIRLL